MDISIQETCFQRISKSKNIVTIVTMTTMDETGIHILVVDDDPGIRDLLSRYLGQQGFKVSTVADGHAMDHWLQRNRPELVILDLMLPGEDGLSLARRLGSRTRIPIIMLSARSDEIDRIIGLEVGADDYLGKPFNPRELLARIRAVLRRQNEHAAHVDPDAPYVTRFGPYTMDSSTRLLLKNDQPVNLSRAEFELLEIFLKHPRRPLSRDFILQTLTGHDHDAFDRSIDVRVTRLRQKIEDQPAHPRYIRTEWGVGYRFTPEG